MLLTPHYFRGVPVRPDSPLWGQSEQVPWAIQQWNFFRSILTYVITVPERPGRTDKQSLTDSHTTYCGTTALCVASRGKMVKIAVYLPKLSQNWNRSTAFWTTLYNYLHILVSPLNYFLFSFGLLRAKSWWRHCHARRLPGIENGRPTRTYICSIKTLKTRDGFVLKLMNSCICL